MNWRVVISISCCMILTGCSKKIHESVEVVKDSQTQSTSQSYTEDFHEVTEMVYVDSAFFCEGVQSAPPSLSPAGVFHGCDVAPLRVAPSKGLRPVLVRRKVERGSSHAADTLQGRESETFYQDKDVKVSEPDILPPIFRWVAFVGIMCLFVYFICVTNRK